MKKILGWHLAAILNKGPMVLEGIRTYFHLGSRGLQVSTTQSYIPSKAGYAIPIA